MTAWPAELPQIPDRDGFKETGPKLQLRTKMETGPDKVRRRTTRGTRKQTMSFLMTTAQTFILDDFYEQNVALTWDFPKPRGGTVKKFRFTEKEIDYTPAGGDYWRVAVEVEEMIA